MDDKKLKIVFISSWYPHKLKPLNGIFVKRHAAANTHDCDVAAIFICSDDANSIEETVEDGIYTIRGYYKLPKLNIPLLFQATKLARYLLMWKKTLSIYKKKKDKPDLINSTIVYPISIIATLIKFTWKVPYVITEHWSGYFPEDGRYKGFIMKLVSKIAVANAGAVITPSYKLRNTMQSLGLIPKGPDPEKNFFVIPNVVDPAIFQLKPLNQKLNTSFNFIHVSSLDEGKNVAGIIRAFNEFHEAHPLSKLTIIWDEEEKEFLTKLKEEPFSEKSGVYLYGKKVGTELAQFLQHADAFILFSNFENLPVVMLESFCCGTPLIGTKVGDIPEYINEKNGSLVEPENEVQLFEAMEKVYYNYGKYKPAEIRNMIIDKISPSAISKQFTGVYRRVLSLSATNNQPSNL